MYAAPGGHRGRAPKAVALVGASRGPHLCRWVQDHVVYARPQCRLGGGRRAFGVGVLSAALSWTAWDTLARGLKWFEVLDYECS
jgi:hypothetical protein